MNITRSYCRKESAAVMQRTAKFPTYNIEIANFTLYVLIYFILKCLDYSTAITPLHITVNGVCIYLLHCIVQ